MVEVAVCPLNSSAAASTSRKVPLRCEHLYLAKPAFLPKIVGLALAMLSSDARDGSIAHAQAPVLTGVIHSTEGDVQGVVADGVAKFLGIPYAAPPVGELRWQPPRDAAHWTQTLQATRFGSTCAQPQRGVFAAPSDAEDCLYLNVF